MTRTTGGAEWYRLLQFVSAVPMPQDICDDFGTTVNGMWADPEGRPADFVEESHSKGQRVLFSVPLIALTPQAYESEEGRPLLDDVCADIDGNPAEVGWYYWEPKPVYSACFYREPFRRYLLDRCREGVRRGMDIVNLDEIMTHIGLMNRDPMGSGFCGECLDRYRRHLAAGPADEESRRILDLDDAGLRDLLRDDDLYRSYRRFHEKEVFTTAVGFIDELRSYARSVNPGFAISANVGYLGNNVPIYGRLWGPAWGPWLDHILLENTYSPDPAGPHLVLPRGKFTAWYRLGAALTDGVPVWICPSIMVPRQMAGEERSTYYQLMFLEAYANAGRWGYYWWPGVDVATRLRATAPEALKDHIRFLSAHREYYEQAVPDNTLAILYSDAAISARPEGHAGYLALAQALAEAGYQYDVLFAGDGDLAPADLDAGALAGYRAVLVPEAGALAPSQAAALAAYAGSGGEVVVFSDAPQIEGRIRRADGEVLARFWKGYGDDDRSAILGVVEPYARSRIVTSEPQVNAIRYVRRGGVLIHLVNYGYDEGSDGVAPIERLGVTIPWESGPVGARFLDLRGEREVAVHLDGGELTVEVPALDLYGLLVLGEAG